MINERIISLSKKIICPEIRYRFFLNLDANYSNGRVFSDTNTISDLINNSFNWERTEEREDFWYSVEQCAGEKYFGEIVEELNLSLIPKLNPTHKQITIHDDGEWDKYFEQEKQSASEIEMKFIKFVYQNFKIK